jgi:two-component system LytT family sensor kinase
MPPGIVAEPRPTLAPTVIGGLGCGVVLALIQATSAHLIRLDNPVAVLNPRSWLMTFSLTLPSWLAIGALAPAFLIAARRYSFDPANRAASAIVHLVLCVVLTLAQLALMSATYLLFATTATARFIGIFGVTFRNLAFLDIVAYWAILGIHLVLHYSTLRVDLAEARLAAMRSQMNPHFLFNSLHAVSALALKGDPAAAAETVGRLSDLLRVVLDDNAREVRLAEELGFLDSYLMIQHVRFADRLQVARSVAPEALTALVPPMILQPLVENALEHGLEGRLGGLIIDVIVTRQGNALCLEVRDNGPGFPTSGPREGIGLANTRGRLEHAYGASCRFTYGRSPQGGASVRISIPFRSAPQGPTR